MLQGQGLYTLNIVVITVWSLVTLCLMLSQPRSREVWLLCLIGVANVSYRVMRLSYVGDADYLIDLGWLRFPLHVFMNMGAGFWMLFCYFFFQEGQRFPRWLLALFAGQVLLSTLRPIVLPNYFLEPELNQTWLGFCLGQLPLYLQTGFAIPALYWIVKDWQNDLIHIRRIMRSLLVAIIGVGYLLTPVLVIWISPTLSNTNRWMLGMDTVISVLIVTALVSVLLRIDRRFLSAILAKAEQEAEIESGKIIESSDASEPYNPDLDAFFKHFVEEKLYLEPGLNVAETAKKLAMPQYKLRELINKKLGYRNFNALLHKYRLEDACAMLADARQRHTPVLTIALTVGYQSIAPFNQAFKEILGVTPTAYRQQALGNVNT